VTIRLDKGRHQPHYDAGCLMEWKMMLCACKGCTDLRARGRLTDSPPCTNAVVTRLVQAVQDRLPDDERQQLLVMAERIDRCRRTSADHRINVRLAIWLARQVMHLIPENEDPRALLAIEAAEAWLADPCEATRVAALTASNAAYAANAAASAYTAAAAHDDAAASDAANVAAGVAYYAAIASAPSNAAAAAAAYYAANAAADLTALLDGLLDHWEKAAADEGVIWEGGDEWADEFCAFTEAWSAATK